MNESINTTESFSKLSHDLMNDFTVIRFMAGYIKKKSPSSDIIDEKVKLINETLNKSIVRVEMMSSLLNKFKENERT